MKKTGVPSLAFAAALVLMGPAILSTGAFAIAPTETTRSGGLHFVGTPDLTVNKVVDESGRVTSASLSATFEVAGAGTGGTATLEATAIVTQGCLNKGGNEPQGLQEATTTVTGSEPFTTDHGRSGVVTVTTNAITTSTEGFTCPSANMTPVLVSVEFTDITLTVEAQTGTITATFADQDP